MDKNSELISLVIPCYNEERNICDLFERIEKVFAQINEVSANHYRQEYLFIDDGSDDGTLSLIASIAGKCDYVKYISFTRNFGKEAAMLAGLEYSSGDYVAIMDADMQDPPELINDMISYIENNPSYDCVAAYRSNRKGEAPIRSFFAKNFYRIINAISEVKIVDGARDFRLMTRRMVNSILRLQERGRFSKGIFAWVGYKTYYIGYNNIVRDNGKSKWSFGKLIRYSMEGITSFSTTLLQLSSFIGGITCVASLITMIYFVIRKLAIGIDIQGYAFIICSILLLGGIQLLSIGIMGQYISRLFLESKARPHYLVMDTNIVSGGEKERDIS